MELFTYGRTELEHLRKRDRRLGRAIDEIGPIEREVVPDPFVALGWRRFEPASVSPRPRRPRRIRYPNWNIVGNQGELF